MRLCCKMHNTYWLISLKQRGNEFTICDISLYKVIIRMPCQICQREGISSVSEYVQIDDAILSTPDQESHQVRADKATPARNKNSWFFSHAKLSERYSRIPSQFGRVQMTLPFLSWHCERKEGALCLTTNLIKKSKS